MKKKMIALVSAMIVSASVPSRERSSCSTLTATMPIVKPGIARRGSSCEQAMPSVM